MPFEDTLFGRPSTVRVYTSLYNNWIKPKPCLSAKEFVNWWANEGVGPRTQIMLLGVLNKYYKFKKIEDPNLIQLKKMVVGLVPADPPKAITKDEAHRLIKTWDDLYPKHQGIVTLGLHTGVRVGEAFGLRWKDIDFVKNRIQVIRSYDGPTKNGKGRLIPMSRVLEGTLIKKENYLGKNLESLVFQRFDINPKLKRTCSKAGIKPITYHALRHTFATLALESGQSIKAVSSILGHSSVKTTIDIYWNILDERLDMGFIE